MGKINGLSKFRKPLAYLPGLLSLVLGIYLVIDQPQVRYVRNVIHEETQLREGTSKYKYWKNLVVDFRVWLFEVTNPEAIIQGENPQLREIGPFVYDLHMNKTVISIDETTDEINYTLVKTYYFNQKKSGNLSDKMEITVLNFAYLGTIQTIASSFGGFLKKLGPSLHTLFPAGDGMFQKGTVGEILFSGLPLDCNGVDQSLTMICNFLKRNPPPLLQKTETPGYLLYSVFYRLNGTQQGPFTVKRGIKNIYNLGDTTSFRNMRITKFWNTDTCNTVMGHDLVTWTPLPEETPSHVNFFEPQLCRSFPLNFTEEEVLHSLKGFRYEITMDAMSAEKMECYCSSNPKKKMECLPAGLMDITKCQEMPIIHSEAHFLYASSEILDYAHGLNSIPKEHKTFVVIEPLTGIPLAGSKRNQINIKITNTPTVPLLANVTNGYFPILWAEETYAVTMDITKSVINGYRLLNVCAMLSWLPVFMGIWLILKAGLCYNQIYYEIIHQRHPGGGAFQ